MKKILLVADFPHWIFARHCREIKKRLIDYDIDIAYHRQDIPSLSKGYDCVYILDPMPLRYPDPHKTIMGLRCEFLILEHPQGAKGLYENGFPGRCTSIKDKCSLFHVVNKNQIKMFKDVVTDKPLMMVQHGVDEEIFNAKKYKKPKNDKLIVGTAGRGNSDGKKGFGVVQKVCDKLGVEYRTTGYHGRLSKEEMPLFYNGIDVYVCFSKTEGLHNPTLEAGAMSIPVVSTRCGAAEEMIRDGENGLLIDRTEEALTNALMKMRDDKFRVNMGNNFYEEIMNNWAWNVKIKDFEKMFELFFETKEK